MSPGKLTRAITLSLMLGASSLAFGQVTVSVNIAPPELPVYDQPPIPGDGYVWTPGYWAWSDDDQDYYWVPGTWVEAPQPGYLWTPGYWGFAGGVYGWNPGYWGPHVGFYGGVNYGYGYTGSGYQGGYWQDGRLFYNRSVVNVGSTHITNVYNRTVVNNVTINRVSYNGGNGINARPSAADEQAAHDRHLGATTVQRDHIDAARRDTAMRVSENHGRPAVAATAQPGHFSGANVVGARNAPTAQPQREPRAGAAPQAPENRVGNHMMRREEPSVAPHPAAPPQSHAERPASPQPHAVQEPHPAPAPHPAESREAPREARPSAPPVEQHQPQAHAQAPRPNVPETRPQPQAHPAAEPHPQERPPEHHP